MLLHADDCQLVLIDYQARLMPAIHDAPAVLANARKVSGADGQVVRCAGLGDRAKPDQIGRHGRIAGAAVRPHRRQDGLQRCRRIATLAGTASGRAARQRAACPSIFKNPQTAAPERGTVVIAGCETHVCLLQTALMLLEAEWDVCVVTDACGSPSATATPPMTAWRARVASW